MDLQAAADIVRKRVDQMPARGTVNLPLPVGEGRWGAKFGLLKPAELEAAQVKIAQAVKADDKAQAIAEFVADSCRCILVQTDDGWQEVTDGGRPVRFGEAFAEALGMTDFDPEAGMAGVVLACWTVDDETLNLMALDAFADRLLRWTFDTNRPVVGELVGESLGSPSSGEPAEQPQTV